jgi:protein O-mannosyl-transferase
VKTWIAIACVIALVLVVYANILGNHFTNWDDEHLIVRNKAIRVLDIPFILKNFHLSYPPLPVISHCLDYLFWRLNPVGYHLTDLIIYALIVLVFFCLCVALIGNNEASFVAAALFAVHPLHVESVAWLSSRKDGLGMLFYLLSFLVYIRSREGRGRGLLWLSVLFYLCAIWSKPLMITLPLALILYDLLLADQRGGLRRSILNKIPYVLPLLLTALATIFLDPHRDMRFSYHGGSMYNTFLAMCTVLGDYLRMLMLPINLCSLYLVELPARVTEIRCLLPLAVIGTILAVAVATVRRAALFSFCVFWGAVSLIPILQLIPVNVIKADRYLYLPTAALCLLCGRAASSALLRPRFRPGALAVCAVVTLLAILTIARNAVWRDSATLWGAVIARNPESADAYNNLGIVYMQRGRNEEAEEILTHAVNLRPDFASAHNNLANVYRVTGRYDKALEEFNKAMGLTHDAVYSANVYIGIGMVHEARGEYSKALEAYEQAVRLNPVYLDDSLLRAHIGACRSAGKATK